jgi:SOS-response transcriptional repressor LexA
MPMHRTLAKMHNRTGIPVGWFTDGVGDDEEELRKIKAITGTPRERFRRAREAAGMTLRDLAKASGYETGYLQALEEGTAPISENTLRRLAPHLPQLDIDYLLSGSETPRIIDEGGISGTVGARPGIALPAGMVARYVPVLSYAQAGTMTEYTDDIYEGEGAIAINLKPTAKAFALPLRGDSMLPRFREGDIAVVRPDLAARNGSLVVAKDHDGSIMFKIYQAADGGRKVTLSSFNPAFPPIEYRREDLAFVYPVQQVIVQNLILD